MAAKFFLQACFAILTFCSITSSLTAQEKRLHGNVTNQFTLEKIPFASVVWKISGSGTITDSLGNFWLDASNAKKDRL
jgi:hypothetical protein